MDTSLSTGRDLMHAPVQYPVLPSLSRETLTRRVPSGPSMRATPRVSFLSIVRMLDAEEQAHHADEQQGTDDHVPVSVLVCIPLEPVGLGHSPDVVQLILLHQAGLDQEGVHRALLLHVQAHPEQHALLGGGVDRGDVALCEFREDHSYYLL